MLETHLAGQGKGDERGQNHHFQFADKINYMNFSKNFISLVLYFKHWRWKFCLRSMLANPIPSSERTFLLRVPPFLLFSGHLPSSSSSLFVLHPPSTPPLLSLPPLTFFIIFPWGTGRWRKFFPSFLEAPNSAFHCALLFFTTLFDRFEMPEIGNWAN